MMVGVCRREALHRAGIGPNSLDLAECCGRVRWPQLGETLGAGVVVMEEFSPDLHPGHPSSNRAPVWTMQPKSLPWGRFRIAVAGSGIWGKLSRLRGKVVGPPWFTMGFYTSQVGGWPLGFLNAWTFGWWVWGSNLLMEKKWGTKIV